MSPEANARNVGVAALPVVGPEKTVAALWVARERARVPEEVTGEPATDKKLGADSATLVTVPALVAERVPVEKLNPVPIATLDHAPAPLR